jgi:hypothetical protein
LVDVVHAVFVLEFIRADCATRGSYVQLLPKSAVRQVDVIWLVDIVIYAFDVELLLCSVLVSIGENGGFSVALARHMRTHLEWLTASFDDGLV